MAPEQDARARAFYDHESEEPKRRNRPAADWGVGEDIFDRMPSRRFKRADRRAEHRDIVIRRGGDDDARERDDDDDVVGHMMVAAPRRDEASSDDDAPSGRASRRDEASWDDDASSGRATRRDEASWDDDAPGGRTLRRDEASWDDDAPGGRASRRDEVAGEPHAASDAAPVDSWMDDDARPLVPGESRTIVIGTAADEPMPRRTVKISGHPDRLPATRPVRPPRTAVEWIGGSPDRIVGYAVALGFLLVLIAVLTTGQ